MIGVKLSFLRNLQRALRDLAKNSEAMVKAEEVVKRTKKLAVKKAIALKAAAVKTEPLKQTVKVEAESSAIEDIEALVKEKKPNSWEPENWREMLEAVREMRKNRDAPVDIVGCEKVADEDLPPKLRRFRVLVSLLLSSLTKDEVNWAACKRLKEFGFTPENLSQSDEEAIAKILHPVGFYRQKAKYLKAVSKICCENHDGDIPNNVEDLCKLPGIGPKMAYLTMDCAWGETVGIGVDTHVHRLTQRWGWLPSGKTKTPEDTRKQLESWLPKSLWRELNWLLVGFGQTICTAKNPKCGECKANKVCPSAFGK